MNVFKFSILTIVSLFVINCKSERIEKPIYSDDINQYNYLDIPHDFKHIYDFENVFTESEYSELFSKLNKINLDKKITFFLITEPKGLKENYLESTKNINNMLQRNHSLDKTITIRMSKSTKVVAISSSKSLEHAIDDLFCDYIIDNILIPNFKGNRFYDGVSIAIDSIMNVNP